MSVNLRKRKNSDGTTSLLLDIYSDGKRTYEFLKHLKLNKISSPLDRQRNRERLKLAEKIKNKREQQIQSDEYDVVPEFRKGIDFVKYFENNLNKYTKRDKRLMNACFNKFTEFLKEKNINEITTKKINTEFVISFKEYLVENLNGETPANYFKKFKKVLRTGLRDKIFNNEILMLLTSREKELSVKREPGIAKEILTFPEIQSLAKVTISNDEVKRAFLFCCNTGLRYCDVKILKWKNIQNDSLHITQQKTGSSVTMKLNANANNVLGKRGNPDEYVFCLPSHTGCLKILRGWCEKSGIQKKITWHCARHSFGTGLVFYGADVKSASGLLGHNSLVYTNRYVRIVEQLKEKAVDNLPEITL